MNSQEIRALQEAYNQVYELDETRTDPRGRPASGPMSVYGGRGQDAGPGGSGDERTDRMDAAQRRVKATQPAAKGRAADALHTKYSRRRRGTGGENPSPSDTTATGHPHSPRRGGRSGRGAETDRGSGNAAARRMREEFEGDLFDYILEHLVAEGYADTNKAALAIMANMSEEWRQSIVEEVLDEELTGERLERAETKIKSLGRKKSTLSSRESLFKVAYGKEGTGLPSGGQPGGRKAPVKRGGGGTKGQAKVSGSGGDDMDRGYGNKAARRG